MIGVFEGMEGAIELLIHLKPTLGFASESAEISSDGDSNKVFLGRTDALQVHCPHLTVENDQVSAEIRLRAGEQTCAVLSYAKRDDEIATLDLNETLKSTGRRTKY